MPDEILEVYVDMEELIDYVYLINNDTDENIQISDINKSFKELGCRATTRYTVCIMPGEKIVSVLMCV